jgi:hypothetical protein
MNRSVEWTTRSDQQLEKKKHHHHSVRRGGGNGTHRPRVSDDRDDDNGVK